MREAIWNGIRRGAQIGIAPDSTRLRELSQRAASTDYTAQAWESVGDSLTAATGSASPEGREEA